MAAYAILIAVSVWEQAKGQPAAAADATWGLQPLLFGAAATVFTGFGFCSTNSPL